MLVLRRRKGEKIIIRISGVPDIIVELSDVQNSAAKIGIQAPPSVKIVREEVDWKRAGE